jgi:hypothetical protein
MRKALCSLIDKDRYRLTVLIILPELLMIVIVSVKGILTMVETCGANCR